MLIRSTRVQLLTTDSSRSKATLCHREVPSIPIQGPARVQQGFNRVGSSTGVLRGRPGACGAGRSSLNPSSPIYRVRFRKLSALSPGFRLSPCAPCDCRVISIPSRYPDLYTSVSLPATNASRVFFRVRPEEPPNKQKSSPPGNLLRSVLPASRWWAAAERGLCQIHSPRRPGFTASRRQLS